MNQVPLTRLQKEIMTEFYSVSKTRVIFNKKEREEIWKKAKSRSNDFDFDKIKRVCPALEHRIRKSYETGKNIQSAVFSECVYAQTFANMLNLDVFVNCENDNNFIPSSINQLLNSYHLVPRYVYSNADKRRMLIQAGGCDGIDSALITVIDLVIYTIEFKEPGAKTSEPDLPKYKEDGKLLVTNEWLKKNPQFKSMLDEQKDLNFFEVLGSNINNFSVESIDYAISNNYTNSKKYADVICTEDINGYLVMLPTNQVSQWADIEGEIRPAGRNHYKVWTPLALKSYLELCNALFVGNKVSVETSKLEDLMYQIKHERNIYRKERGGNDQISGYKITPVFFVYSVDCEKKDAKITFEIEKVQQLNPTIAAKMFFKKLDYSKVKTHYGL